jgi:predicted SAM-dependent methyltransferase
MSDVGERYSREDLIAMDGEPVELNVGCGTDERGVGIDLNYEEADIEADLDDGIPIEDSAVDRVIAEHVLEHLENPAATLREINRVLRDDGEAVVEVPNVGWLPVRLYVTRDLHSFWLHKIPGESGHWLARRIGDPDPDRTPHLTLWTKELLRFHLERAGLSHDVGSTRHWVRNLRVTARPAETADGHSR